MHCGFLCNVCACLRSGFAAWHRGEASIAAMLSGTAAAKDSHENWLPAV